MKLNEKQKQMQKKNAFINRLYIVDGWYTYEYAECGYVDCRRRFFFIARESVFLLLQSPQSLYHFLTYKNEFIWGAVYLCLAAAYEMPLNWCEKNFWSGRHLTAGEVMPAEWWHLIRRMIFRSLAFYQMRFGRSLAGGASSHISNVHSLHTPNVLSLTAS